MCARKLCKENVLVYAQQKLAGRFLQGCKNLPQSSKCGLKSTWMCVRKLCKENVLVYAQQKLAGSILQDGKCFSAHMEKSISPWYNKEMSYYHAGTTIKETRERKKIAQEDLCYGLCSVATLSKIENGRQNPNRKLLEALTQRLGIPLGLYNIPITQVEYRRYQIEYEVVRLLAKGGAKQDEELMNLLREYESCSKGMDSLEQQFYKTRLAILHERKNEFKEARSLLEESIRLSIPNFSLEHIHTHRLLTRDEVTILINLARIMYFQNERETATSILYSLKTFFEKQTPSHELFSKIMPCILFNLANYEEDNGDFEAECSLAQEGIDICIEHDKLAYLDLLLFQKGYALAKLGEFKKAGYYLTRSFNLSLLKDALDRYEQGYSAVKEEFGNKIKI